MQAAILRQASVIAKRTCQNGFSYRCISVSRPSCASEKTENNSFVMNMFKGEACMDQMFPYPQVLTEEQAQTTRMMVESFDKFMKESNDPSKNDAEGKISDSTLKKLAELGGFGMQVPEEYGGFGAVNTQVARFSQMVGEHDLALGVTLGAHQSIGYKAIMLYGTEEQKKKYLPDLASGRRFAAYCLTEPASGSDAMSISTKAVPTPDGKHYILNGNKVWISNGGFADVFTVFAKTPVKQPDGHVKDKMTAFIVERSMGVQSGPPEKKMGIRASSTTTLTFDDVKVPAENVIGEVGKGFKVAMNVLNNGRFGLGSIMCGTMKDVIRRSVDHVTQRSQFGNKLATYGAIQEKLARMHMLHYIGESMTFMLSGNMDRGFTEYHLEAALTKVFASEAAWWCVDEAIQVHGGMGFMVEAQLERIMRDCRIFRIFEGANDVMRLFVALQGLQYAGGHLKELQKALSNPAAHLGLILDYGTKRLTRAVGLSSGPPLDSYVPSRLSTNAALASRCIEQFGAAVEHLLIKYGKNIIGEQYLLTRLANSAIDVYAMIVVLSRCTNSINKKLSSAEHEAMLVDIICSEASERVMKTLGGLRAGEKLANYGRMRKVAEAMCSEGGIVSENPLGI